MNFCRNVSVSGEYQQEQVLSPPCSKLGALTPGSIDDLFSAQNTEVDVSLEWLSIFVEDCLSSTGNCLPAAAPTSVENTNLTPKPLQQVQKPKEIPSSFQKFVIPGKARSKRRRVTNAKIKNPLTSWSHNLNPHNYLTSSDPPLLQQAYWLADSELILPKTEEKTKNIERYSEQEEEAEDKKIMMLGHKECVLEGGGGSGGVQPRRCTHCLSQRTPQWRAGPLGPKTLCNACGVRYKSGRLLPEYRPAKSPTFVSYLHSNSHKKVMEMRMNLLPSLPSEQ